MESQVLLMRINNQCAVVQTVISVCYEKPEDKALTAELKRLRETLDEYFKHFP